MEQPYARPQVASVTVARDWNPAILLMAVVFGMIVGLGLGLKDQVLRRGLNYDESYMLLASTLYGQDPTPSIAATLRQKLVSLNFTSPAIQVLKLADRFSQSRDRERQRDAEGLRLFGEALNTSVDPVAAEASLSVSAASTVSAVDSPTAAVPTSTAPPQPSPVATMASAGASIAAALTVTPASTPTPANTPTVQPTAPATVAASGAASATVQSNDGKTLVLRREASSKAAKVVSMPNGSKVQVIRQVSGEAVEGQDARWYLVKYKDLTGYAYAKYIATGN